MTFVRLAVRTFSSEAYTPRLWDTPVVEIGRNLENTENETENNPKLNVCTSLADISRSSQATTARENESRSL